MLPDSRTQCRLHFPFEVSPPNLSCIHVHSTVSDNLFSHVTARGGPLAPPLDRLCKPPSSRPSPPSSYSSCASHLRYQTNECKNTLQPTARIELAASRLKACHSTTELRGLFFHLVLQQKYVDDDGSEEEIVYEHDRMIDETRCTTFPTSTAVCLMCVYHLFTDTPTYSSDHADTHGADTFDRTHTAEPAPVWVNS